MLPWKSWAAPGERRRRGMRTAGRLSPGLTSLAFPRSRISPLPPARLSWEYRHVPKFPGKPRMRDGKDEATLCLGQRSRGIKPGSSPPREVWGGGGRSKEPPPVPSLSLSPARRSQPRDSAFPGSQLGSQELQAPSGWSRFGARCRGEAEEGSGWVFRGALGGFGVVPVTSGGAGLGLGAEIPASRGIAWEFCSSRLLIQAWSGGLHPSVHSSLIPASIHPWSIHP